MDEMETHSIRLDHGFCLGRFYCARQQYGTLTGIAQDEQGGVLPGVIVTLESPDLIGGTRVELTGASGTYTFRNLPPGDYSVRFELTGFGAYARKGIIITGRLDVGGTQGMQQYNL